VWLGDGRSTLDLYGRGFVLLRLGTNSPAVSLIETAAAARRVPLEIIPVLQPDVMQLDQHRLVLVRPDGHVAWRANELPPNADVLIDKVRGAKA
jgi:Aromatic-ring hydroxylase, C-terminal